MQLAPILSSCATASSAKWKRERLQIVMRVFGLSGNLSLYMIQFAKFEHCL
jgi:hypothetical protein